MKKEKERKKAKRKERKKTDSHYYSPPIWVGSVRSFRGVEIDLGQHYWVGSPRSQCGYVGSKEVEARSYQRIHKVKTSS